MLARLLLAVALTMAAVNPVSAEDVKIVALGVADHPVSETELSEAAAPSPLRFDTPGVAYVLIEGLKEGDEVRVALLNEGQSLMHNIEKAVGDKPILLQAGKTNVPAGGWPEGKYSAKVTVSRGGEEVLVKESSPFTLD